MGGTGWRKKLSLMRTRGALARPSLRPGALRLVGRLSDEALAAAAHNPAHSEADRAAARDEAQRRGLSLDDWRLAVPGFLNAEALAKGERVFFGAGRALRRGFGLSILPTVLVIFALIGWAEPASERLIAAAEAAGLIDPDTAAGADLMFWSDAQGRDVLARLPASEDADRVRLGSALAYPSVLLFAACGLAWGGATALRRRPARILLLRRFNDARIAKGLGRFLSGELRPFGHVMSLSDKHLRRSRFGWVRLAILAPTNPLAALSLFLTIPVRMIDRSRFGPAFVASAWDYRNLARRLRDRVGLNLQVAGTQKEAFLIRTSDTWWKMVVALLFDSCDAVVVDLSDVSAGTEWELERIRALEFAPATLLVTRADRAAYAADICRACGIEAPLFAYDALGEVEDRAAFRAAMLAAMRAAAERRARG